MDDSKLNELRLIHKDLATYLKNQHEAMSNCLLTAAALRMTVNSDPNLRKLFETNRRSLLEDETFQAGLRYASGLERILKKLTDW